MPKKAKPKKKLPRVPINMLVKSIRLKQAALQAVIEKAKQQTANSIADYVEKRLSPYTFREYLGDCVNGIREGRWRDG